MRGRSLRIRLLPCRKSAPNRDGATLRHRFPLSGKRSYLAEGSKSVKKSLFFKKGIDKILFLCYPFLMVSFI